MASAFDSSQQGDKTIDKSSIRVPHMAEQPPGVGGLAAPDVVIMSDDRSLWVKGTLADEGAQPVGGGGWEPVQRPGRRSLTVWRNPGDLGMTVAMFLDGNAHGHSVEAGCRTIEEMAGAFTPGKGEPPRLIVAGPSLPHGYERTPAARWVISEPPEWGDVIRRPDGKRTRAFVTLTLLLFTETDELERIKPRQPRPDHRVIRARKGDTYLKIARRELGSDRYGRRLAKLNGDHDPHKTLREGAKVKLPSASTLADWKRDLKVKG